MLDMIEELKSIISFPIEKLELLKRENLLYGKKHETSKRFRAMLCKKHNTTSIDILKRAAMALELARRIRCITMDTYFQKSIKHAMCFYDKSIDDVLATKRYYSGQNGTTLETKEHIEQTAAYMKIISTLLKTIKQKSRYTSIENRALNTGAK